jgi:lysophospholipase L1-like esterase
LIELGTNDVFQCVGTASAVKDLSLIIDKLRRKNTSVKILLAQIPPLGNQWAPKKLCGTDTAYDQAIKIFNEAVLHFARVKMTARSPVIIVDQFTGVDPATDMYDDIHPNEKGEMIMAERWYKALKPFLTKLK